MIASPPRQATTDTAAVEPRESAVSQFVPALLFTLVSVVLFGFVYPLVITVISNVAFPFQSGGSLVRSGDRVIGSKLAGQRYTSAKYLHGRPSAAGKDGYDPTSTGGTNLGPTNKKLIAAVKAEIARVEKENGTTEAPPIDLVTSSGSGVDPDISPASAHYQQARIARARGIDVSVVARIIDGQTKGPTLGILGESRVSVLGVNMALDAER